MNYLTRLEALYEQVNRYERCYRETEETQADEPFFLRVCEHRLENGGPTCAGLLEDAIAQLREHHPLASA